MKNLRWAVTITLTFCMVEFSLIIPAHAATIEKSSSLTLQLNQLLNNEPDLNGAISGISVRTSSDGKIIYEHNGDIRLRPASNLKLITASAALAVLGESYTFSTEVYATGKIRGDKLNGDLYLKGKGDPTLTKADFEKIAEEIRRKGIKIIKGNLIGDDSWYDDVRYSFDLPWSDETTYYGAPVSALTASPTKEFDAGSVIVDVFPGKKFGAKAVVKMTPKTNTIIIVNHTETNTADGKKRIHIYRKHESNQIIVDGQIPVKANKTREWISVQSPSKYALDLFHQALRRKNIIIEGKTQIGPAPSKAKLLSTRHSIPLSQLLIPFMKLSNNGHAEVLVKEMGKIKKGEGSWEKGLEVVKNELSKFGVDPQNTILRDGSGVSHVNMITANQLSQLLFAIQHETWFSVFQNSLPAAGKQEKMLGGTLRNRFREPMLRNKILAKTGTISTVSSLSGYIDTQSGQRLIFSILLNNLLDEEDGKRIEDKIAACLSRQ